MAHHKIIRTMPEIANSTYTIFNAPDLIGERKRPKRPKKPKLKKKINRDWFEKILSFHAPYKFRTVFLSEEKHPRKSKPDPKKKAAQDRPECNYYI